MTTNSTPFALRLDWARGLFDRGDFGAAATALRELVDLHLLLGRTLQRQRRHTDAQRHLALAEVLGDYERPAAYATPTA